MAGIGIAGITLALSGWGLPQGAASSAYALIVDYDVNSTAAAYFRRRGGQVSVEQVGAPFLAPGFKAAKDRCGEWNTPRVFDRVVSIRLASISTDDGVRFAEALSRSSLRKNAWQAIRETDIKDGDLRMLRALSHLRELNLLNTHITDAGLIHLATLRRLEDLTLSGTLVTDVGLERVAAIRSLRALELVGLAVTDDGIAELTALPHLRYIDLRRTKVTSEGLLELAAVRSLRTVIVSRITICAEEMRSLRAKNGDLEIRFEQ